MTPLHVRAVGGCNSGAQARLVGSGCRTGTAMFTGSCRPDTAVFTGSVTVTRPYVSGVTLTSARVGLRRAATVGSCRVAAGRVPSGCCGQGPVVLRRAGSRRVAGGGWRLQHLVLACCWVVHHVVLSPPASGSCIAGRVAAGRVSSGGGGKGRLRGGLPMSSCRTAPGNCRDADVQVVAVRPARVHAVCLVGRQLDRRTYLSLRPEHPKELQHLGPPHLCAGAGQPRLMSARRPSEGAATACAGPRLLLIYAATQPPASCAGRRPARNSRLAAGRRRCRVSLLAMHTACRLRCCKFAS